jgi:DNA-binding CsgD family transcriptional regulator
LLGVSSSKEIGVTLGISPAAVDFHISQELRARRLGSRAELALVMYAEAARAGVVEPSG